jgi:hypothetical protein
MRVGRCGAGSIAAAAGLSTGKSKIEGLRSKLKRLVERGWLAEDGPGLFTLVGAENRVSPYATWAYSWIRPPSRSRRRTRIPVTSAGGCARPAGGSCCSAQRGRWMLSDH